MFIHQPTKKDLRVGSFPKKQLTPVAPPYPIYTPSEVKVMREKMPALGETLDWMWGFLTNPHVDLGRPGAVCPFAEYAIELETVWMTVIDSPAVSGSTIEEMMMQYRDIFLQKEPTTGKATINKALAIIFPHVPTDQAPDLIDVVQANLKPQFTQMGLMLGEFHKHNRTPGLRNENFFPLRSPIPMLVIRYMVESDLPFLTREIDSPSRRVAFLKAYLRRLASNISDKQMDQIIVSLLEAMLEERGIHDILVESGIKDI